MFPPRRTLRQLAKMQQLCQMVNQDGGMTQPEFARKEVIETTLREAGHPPKGLFRRMRLEPGRFLGNKKFHCGQAK
jgi:hypothetical protein